MIKTTVLATILALSIPCAVKAQTVEIEAYKDYQVSCETGAACQDFGVTYEEDDQKVAQYQNQRTRTRTRTRTRRTRTSIQAFQNWYTGAGAGIFFGDGLDLGFQGHVFGGTKFNDYIGTDLEFTFGFAGVEDIDENVTLLGLYLNPRFEYQFENSNLTAFVSPGLGFIRASSDGESDTEFDFQIKTGVSFPLKETTDVYVQGRYQNEAEAFGIEGGAIFDL